MACQPTAEAWGRSATTSRTCGGARCGVAARRTPRRGRGSQRSPLTGFPSRASFIPGRSSALPSRTQGGSRVPESGPLGSVRGALSNGRPYRDHLGLECAIRSWAFLDGLLSGVERKTGWLLAEQAGLERPYRIQSLLGRGRWEADALRDHVRTYAIEALGDEDGVLVIDETGFVKKGVHSVGVSRQYSGTAGGNEKFPNC